LIGAGEFSGIFRNEQNPYKSYKKNGKKKSCGSLRNFI